ncbi:MAG: hypothetical protein NVSMB47_19790 [Polyangiales bacterium]
MATRSVSTWDSATICEPEFRDGGPVQLETQSASPRMILAGLLTPEPVDDADGNGKLKR